jgi:hypothetical protein
LATRTPRTLFWSASACNDSNGTGDSRRASVFTAATFQLSTWTAKGRTRRCLAGESRSSRSLDRILAPTSILRVGTAASLSVPVLQIPYTNSHTNPTHLVAPISLLQQSEVT